MSPARAAVTRVTDRLSGHGHQLRGSFWVTAAVGVNAVGGFAFWLVAARLYDQDDVGQATALFTTVLFVNYAASLGLPVAVARYASGTSPDANRLFNGALAVTAAGSALAAVVVLLVLPSTVTAPLRGGGGLAGIAFFFLAVVGVAFAVLVEVRLMALRRWYVIVVRAVLVAVIRIPLLAWSPLPDALWLFVLVAGVPALSGFVVVALIGPGTTGWSPRPFPETTRRAVHFAGVNYIGLLALQAPQFALPFIVLVNVSATTMASFYIAFSIATLVFLVPHTLGQVLLVEGGRGTRHPRSQVKLTLVLGVGAMTLAALATVTGVDLVVAVYGQDYQAAADALPWFVVAGVPWAVTCSLLARVRIYEYREHTLYITGALALATLVPAVLLVPDHGVAGAAAAWIAGNVVAAAVALVVTIRDRVPRAP